jgi:DNA-binding SARP family transcriptional activator
VTGRVRQAARAAASITALTALLAAAPYALARWTGSPVPRHPPGLSNARAFLTSPLSDEAVIRLMADTAWLLWAVFAVSVITEGVAAARHRAPPRLPVISPVQALAAALVGAAVITSAPTPRAAVGPATLHAVLAASAGPFPGPKPPSEVWPGQAPVRLDGSPSPHVGYHGLRARTFEVHLVVAGENLWDIAERHLGDAQLWPEIYALNQDRPQPDGQQLTNPRLILPGWLLLIPAPGQPSRVGGLPAPAPGHPSGKPTVTPTAHPPASSAPRPSATAPPATGPSHSLVPAAPAPGPASRAEPHPKGGARLPSGEIIGYTLVALAGGAAVTVARLCLRRTRQPAPVPGTAPEYPPPGPAIRAARHAHLISGALGDDHDGQADVTGFPAPAPVGHVPLRAGESALAVSAAVRRGREIALDLASAPGFGFTGPGGDAAIRAMAVTILAQRTRDQPQVLVCGPSAARLLAGTLDAIPDGVPGLAVAAALDALAALEAELIRRHRILQAAGTDSIGGYRAIRPDDDLPVITAIAVNGPHTARLAGILHTGAQLGITGIISGPWPGGATCEVAADGRVLAATGSARALSGARMFQLPASAAAEILQTLATAAGAPGPPAAATPQRPIPAPPQARDQDQTGGAHLAELSVLGPFQLASGGTPITRGMRRKAAELLAYLAVYPGGATTPVLLEALWPGMPPERAGPILHAATTNIRGLLRNAARAPESAFVVRVGDHLRIDARLIGCDLWRFRTALANAASADSDQDRIAALEEATRLWRGDLADGIDAVWIEEHRETLRRDAADALARLAELYEQDNPERALMVLDRAITVDRYQEELYRRIMTAQAALGRPDAARRTYQLLESRLAELDAEPDEQTAQLLHQITTRQARDGVHVGSSDQ